MMDFTIKAIPTSKDKIKQPEMAIANIIPKINTSSLFVGSSGSGKTTLVANLLTRKDMLKKAFDRTFLISPTAKTDDIQKFLKLPDDDIIDKLSEAPGFLREIMDEQVGLIADLGADTAPKYLVFYDDVVSDPDFMKTDEFVRSFIMNRHFNFTTMICSQSYTAIPRKCRLQAKHIFYFKGSESENETIMEDRAPPYFNKQMGLELIEVATRDDFDFLHIHMGVPIRERYRRNLNEIINVELGHNSNLKSSVSTNERADYSRQGKRGGSLPESDGRTSSSSGSKRLRSESGGAGETLFPKVSSSH
jgi:hypothetical protein